ncbi:MAG TPA: GAF domain-containing sensor histidine kinase [Ktedonobacterales bacterium]
MASGVSDAERLAHLNRELQILNSIAQALNGSVALDETLHATLAQVAELLGLETGWIWLLDEETGASYLGAAQNLPRALTKNPHRMTGSCFCLDTYRNGDMEGAANVNVVRCSRLSGLVDDTNGLRYHASIPLYAHGKKLGVLNVASRDWRELGPDDLRLLYTVGDMVSIAIERARLFAASARLGAAEERNRLAREIHDTIAQGLAGLGLQLETADALLDAGADPQRVQRVVREALALARANLDETRRSVHDLRAAPLEDRLLGEALEELARDWTAQGNPPVRVTLAGDRRRLAVRVESGLYRIAQEALANIAHHAQASCVTLRLETLPEQVRLVIEDDGRGFDTAEPEPAPTAAAADGHYGLVGLSERAKLLGGTLRLESAPDAGTRIDVTVPFTATEQS